jgi:hypothetical protein
LTGIAYLAIVAAADYNGIDPAVLPVPPLHYRFESRSPMYTRILNSHFRYLMRRMHVAYDAAA